LTEDEYCKRTGKIAHHSGVCDLINKVIDTVRAFKERNKLGRFSDEAAAKEEATEIAYKEALENMKVGDRCEVASEDNSMMKRGTVKFIGKAKVMCFGSTCFSLFITR
jgi:hypothetical protein